MSDLEFLNEAFSSLQKNEFILGRDTERQQIKDFIDNNISGSEDSKSTCLIYGQPGTGKSLAVTTFFKSKEFTNGSNTVYRYVNCMSLDQANFSSCMISLIKILDQNNDVLDDQTPQRVTQKLIESYLDNLYSSMEGIPVIVLDEADVLNGITIKNGKSKQSVLEYLIRYTQKHDDIINIYIGNTLDLIEHFTKSIKSKIYTIPFKTYEAEDLVEIARQKIELLKKHFNNKLEFSLDFRILELGVRRATSNYGGDCRRVFNTIRKIIESELTNKGTARKAMMDNISCRGNVIRATLESLPLHTQITMIAIVREQNKQKENDDVNINFYSVYFTYKSICLSFHIKCLPEESTKRALDVLAANGLITSCNTEVKSNKRVKTVFRSPGRLAMHKTTKEGYVTNVTKEVMEYVSSNETDILSRLVDICKTRGN